MLVPPTLPRVIPFLPFLWLSPALRWSWSAGTKADRGPFSSSKSVKVAANLSYVHRITTLEKSLETLWEKVDSLTKYQLNHNV